jgi:hypothetical protein
MGAAGSRVPARGGLGEQCVTQGLQDVLEGELGGWDVAGSGGREGFGTTASKGTRRRRSVPHARGGCEATYLKVGE